MKPEDLDAALEKLWAKAAEPRESPGSFPLPSADIPRPPFLSDDSEERRLSRGAALEALALVKRQQRESQARWERALELKESAIRGLSESLRKAEQEIETLRRRCGNFDARMVEEISRLAQKLEAAHELLRQEEQRAANEERRLVQAMEELETENRSLRRQESASRGELEDLRKKHARHQQESERTGSEIDGLRRSVREGRDALAGALAQLLAEREAKEKAEDAAGEAQARLAELGDRLARVEKLWHEERRQWQELFEREKRAS